MTAHHQEDLNQIHNPAGGGCAPTPNTTVTPGATELLLHCYEMGDKRASRVSTTQSLSAISESGPSDDEIVDVHIPTAPDGGYGWVIVLASFLCFIVVDGTIFSMGRFIDEFQRHFNSSKSKAAWVASIMSGWYLLVGPVAAGLSNALGCRTVAILGSILAATGLALSPFVNGMGQLYLTAGCMTGIGFGFIYLPAACTISFYFAKKRAFATGMAVCGSGIGGFLLGPATNWLINKTGWQKSLLVLAGMALSCSLITALFKPLKAVEVGDDQEDDWGADDIKHLGNNNNNIAGSHNSNKIPINGNPKNTQNGSTPSLIVREAVAAAKFQSNFELNTDYRHNVEGSSSRQGSIIVGSQHDLRKASSGVKMIGGSRKSIDHHRSKLSIDYGALRARGLSIASLSHERRLTQPDLKPMLRKDIFLSASLQRIPEYRSQANISQYHASVLHIPTLLGDDGQKVWGCLPQSLVDALRSMLSLDLFRSPCFWILAISGFLTMMGFFIPFLYLCDAAVSRGVDKDQAVLLLAVIGITNTAGRVFCGWVSDMPSVSALAINNAALIAGGAATALLPDLLMRSFGLLCVYAAIFGFSIACFAALRSIIVVELFGVEKLTNGFGLLLLFQGVASLIGSPTAGFLYDLTNDYNATFYFFGVLITFSGLMCLPVNAVMRWEQRRNRDQADVEMSPGERMSK